jgi:hypothetical protein
VARGIGAFSVWLALAALVVAGAAASNPAGIANADALLTPGSFITICSFSHRAADDPIVHFGKPGASHDHTFVGNVSTNAFSTLASLRRARTTCSPASDTAAYWAPTLLVDGRPVMPTRAVIYYDRLTKAPVKPYPPGLRIVAGNAFAGSRQSTGVTFWQCGVIKTTLYGQMRRVQGALPSVATSIVPSCPPGSRLQLRVNFPDCWNGKTLDSLNHASHMAYSRNKTCPRGHPVPVPALGLVYEYPPPQGVVVLSSGPAYTGHADFVNAWDQQALATIVARCLNTRRVCVFGT